MRQYVEEPGIGFMSIIREAKFHSFPKKATYNNFLYRVATGFLERYYCVRDFGLDRASERVIYQCSSYIKTGAKNPALFMLSISTFPLLFVG